MTLEADTKLVGDALETMKLIGAKDVDSPRVRRNEEQTAQTENSEKLTSIESTSYRSLVMKLAYVAQDRVDIAEAVKCLTRHMKEPRSERICLSLSWTQREIERERERERERESENVRERHWSAKKDTRANGTTMCQPHVYFC